MVLITGPKTIPPIILRGITGRKNKLHAIHRDIYTRGAHIPQLLIHFCKLTVCIPIKSEFKTSITVVKTAANIIVFVFVLNSEKNFSLLIFCPLPL
jgi:hypothetical protein